MTSRAVLAGVSCHQVILIRPDERKRCKTDRRDAAALSELLWVKGFADTT